MGSPLYPQVVSRARSTEAEVIGAFGHGLESLPTTARGTLRAIL